MTVILLLSLLCLSAPIPNSRVNLEHPLKVEFKFERERIEMGEPVVLTYTLTNTSQKTIFPDADPKDLIGLDISPRGNLGVLG